MKRERRKRKKRKVKRTFISKLLLLTLASLVISSILVFFSLPKSVILDRFLTTKGIGLIPERVREGTFRVEFEKVRVFFKNELVSRLDSLGVYLKPAGLGVLAVCGEGYLKGHVSLLGDLSAEAKGFECLEMAGKVYGNVRLEESRLFGRVSLENLDLKGIKVDRVDLEFKGDRFDGNVEYSGMKLRGGGSLRLNPSRLEDSEINAVFRGDLGRLVLKGRLGSPSVQLR